MKIYVILFLSLLCASVMHAQDSMARKVGFTVQPSHMFLLNKGRDSQKPYFVNSKGYQINGFLIGTNFEFALGKNWSFVTGLSVQSNKNRVQCAVPAFAFGAGQPEIYNWGHVDEKLTYLKLPFNFQHITPFRSNKSLSFYVKGGMVFSYLLRYYNERVIVKGSLPVYITHIVYTNKLRQHLEIYGDKILYEAETSLFYKRLLAASNLEFGLRKEISSGNTLSFGLSYEYTWMSPENEEEKSAIYLDNLNETVYGTQVNHLYDPTYYKVTQGPTDTKMRYLNFTFSWILDI